MSTATWLAVGAVLLSGCTGPGSESYARPAAAALRPCAGAPASSVDLGTPGRGGPTAFFETTGAPLFVTTTDIDLGPIFDYYPAMTAVYVGPAATPPTYDQQRSTVEPLTAEVSVVEDEFAELDVPAGKYWLWSSNVGRIEVASCEEGGVSGEPASSSR